MFAICSREVLPNSTVLFARSSSEVREMFANPDPYPTPTPYKGSTVSYYPYLPVLPKPVGGDSEQEENPKREIPIPELKEIPW